MKNFKFIFLFNFLFLNFNINSIDYYKDDIELSIKPNPKKVIKLLNLKIAHQKKMIQLSEKGAPIKEFGNNKEFIIFTKQFQIAAVAESDCLKYILQLAEAISDSLILKRKFTSDIKKMIEFENLVLNYLQQILTLIKNAKSIDEIFQVLESNFDV